MDSWLEKILDFIRQIYPDKETIALHEPIFVGKEREYVLQAIDSTFVSSVGPYVERFEQQIAKYVGSKYAVATVNGTAALHLALLVAGVAYDTEVITQPLTFIATINAIAYIGAHPVFLDVDEQTLSIDPQLLEEFLSTQTHRVKRDGKWVVVNKNTGRVISACLPVHVFGFPAKIDRIVEICNEYQLPVIEDSAESLGSFFKNKHTGTFGLAGVFSFNGNKIITTGGGGMIVTNDPDFAQKARHLSTQAKVPHPWEYIHDQIGFNYRLTNIQAALGVAQLEKLEYFIQRKRQVARLYQQFFANLEYVQYIAEPPQARANYWLNTIRFADFTKREEFINLAHKNKILVRPVWRLASNMPMFKHEFSYRLELAPKLEKQLVNLPSSVIVNLNADET